LPSVIRLNCVSLVDFRFQTHGIYPALLKPHSLSFFPLLPNKKFFVRRTAKRALPPNMQFDPIHTHMIEWEREKDLLLLLLLLSRPARHSRVGERVLLSHFSLHLLLLPLLLLLLPSLPATISSIYTPSPPAYTTQTPRRKLSKKHAPKPQYRNSQ